MPGKLKTIASIFSVDCVIFGLDEKELKVLLIERGEEPYLNEVALPGDLVQIDENIDDAAIRILEELTGLKDIFLEQLHTFGDVDRHPWGRIITVAYYSLIKLEEYHLNPSSFATAAEWHPISAIPKLAFDHNKISVTALAMLKGSVINQPIGFELLPRKFSLTQLQSLYETILETNLDKRNFRRKILRMNLLKKLDEKQTGVPHKAAELYKFDKKKYKDLKSRGFNFEI